MVTRRNNYSNSPQNDYWKWFLIYIGIGFVISIIIPFPFSLIVYLLLFFVLNFIRTDITLRKSGMKDGVKGLYKSMSSGFSDGNMPGNIGYSPIRFMCMNCSKEHNGRTCPRCGSTAVRAA